MKFGIRKPNLKKSIKARTTGKAKRAIKKAVNPFYGKKGMGYIKDPKKAVYNKVYNKTTVDARDIIGNGHSSRPKTSRQKKSDPATKRSYSPRTYKGTGIFLIVVACILMFMGLFILPVGLIFIGLGVLFLFIGIKYVKIAKLKDAETFDDDIEGLDEKQ